MNNTQKWLTEQELTGLFKKSEDDSIERCESPKNKDKIAKAICAFSNNLSQQKKPSVIFIGVTDDGRCSNLSITDEMLRNISSIRSDGNLQPFPMITVGKQSIEECEIIVVQVQPSANPPMRYKHRCWVHIGPSVRAASEDEEKILIEKRQAGNLPEDMKGISYADIETDLNVEFFKTQYLPLAVPPEIVSANNRDIKTQMRSLRFLDYQLHPTMTAILVLGKDPRQWFPGAYIQFIRFDGTTLTDSIKNQLEISGALQDQIHRIEEILKANISTSLVLSDKQNIQSPDYPTTALSQLIRNAVIHRNYGSNTPIKIH